jgi:hypothetical protein
MASDLEKLEIELRNKAASEKAERANKLSAYGSYLEGGLSLIGGIVMSESLRMQGEWEKEQHEFNAGVARKEAQARVAKGKRDAAKFEKKESAILGKQKTASAASGVEVGFGSSGSIGEQTRRDIHEDSQMIRNNAAREAYGLEMEAIDKVQQSEFAASVGRTKGTLALVSGIGDAVGSVAEGFGKLAKDGISKAETEDLNTKIDLRKARLQQDTKRSESLIREKQFSDEHGSRQFSNRPGLGRGKAKKRR